MPSAERSGGGSLDSSTPGPPRGDPDSATYSVLPSFDSLMPRGRLPTGMRATTSPCSGSTTTTSPPSSALT